MTNQEQLKLALNTVYSQKSEELLNSNNIEWTYTENYDFQKKLQVLINRQKHSYWKFTNTRAKKFVIAVAALIILLSSTMTVPAVRKPVVDFIIKTYHEFSTYFISESDSQGSLDKIKNECIPSYIPQGFSEKTRIPGDISLLIIWENDKGDSLSFSQNLLSLQGNIDTEEVTVQKFMINNLEITSYENKNRRVYMWNTLDYSFSLDVPSTMKFSEIEKIISSVEK